MRDELSRERRDLPWVRVDQHYLFDGPEGQETLSDLFEGRSQLIVYHFMFAPTWEEGCKSCSFWADNFNGIVVHLNHRDVTLVTVSKAPVDKLEAFKKRMDWRFKWVSSFGNEFNRDYHVSFTQLARGECNYNYQVCSFPSEEAPGISAFFREQQGEIFHAYCCYARGLDMLNGAYHYLDLTSKGRDEAHLPRPMACGCAITTDTRGRGRLVATAEVVNAFASGNPAADQTDENPNDGVVTGRGVSSPPEAGGTAVIHALNWLRGYVVPPSGEVGVTVFGPDENTLGGPPVFISEPALP